MSYKRGVFRSCWQRFADGFSIYCASVKHDLAHGSTRRSRRKSVGVVRCAKTKESVSTPGIGTKRPNDSRNARAAIEDSIIAGSSFAGAIRLAASNYRSVIGAEFLLSLNLRAVRLSGALGHSPTPPRCSSLIKPIKPRDSEDEIFPFLPRATSRSSSSFSFSRLAIPNYESAYLEP